MGLISVNHLASVNVTLAAILTVYVENIPYSNSNMMNCAHVLVTGKRKGQICGKKTDRKYCSRHHLSPSSSSMSGNSQFFETLEILQMKQMTLDTSVENKRIILIKFCYLETLSVTSTEYHKNLNWLRHALNFPYNKTVEIPVQYKNDPSKEDTAKISNYVTQVYDKLDSYIYGIHDVKEELMSFVCKRISNP